MKTFVLGWRGKWPMYSSEWTLNALTEYRDVVLGCDKTTCIAVGNNGTTEVYFTAEEVNASQERNRSVYQDTELITAFVRDAERVILDMADYGKHLSNLDARSANAMELKTIFESCGELMTLALAHYQLSNSGEGDAVWTDVSKWLNRKRLYEPTLVQDALVPTSSTDLLSFQEQREWLNICEEYLAHSEITPSLRRTVGTHAQRYGFLGRTYDQPWGFGEDEYLKRLTLADAEGTRLLRQRIRNSVRRGNRARDIAAATARRLDLPEYLSRTCNAIGALSAVRLRFNEAMRLLMFAREPFMVEIRRLIRESFTGTLPDYLFDQLNNREICEILLGEDCPTTAELVVRHGCSILEICGGSSHMLTGDDARRHLVNKSKSHKRRANSALLGTGVAGRNTVEGRAIVVGAQGVKAILTGDAKRDLRNCVVVANAIKPDFVALCLEASGIITEEGGVTSHAAMIARDLGIACVVGVKDATLRIKSGDRVRMSPQSGRIALPQRKGGVLVQQPESVAKTHRDVKTIGAVDGAVETAVQAIRSCDPSPLVVDLGDPVAANSSIVGAKARNLHQIQQSTPPGFVITAETVRRCHFEYSSDSAMPTGVWDSIKERIDEMGLQQVAVRSSSRHEGVEGLSYSGLYSSVIGVDAADDEALAGALRIVGKSERSAVVSQYEDSMGIRKQTGQMAIVVQQMVSPMVSGIVSTSIQRKSRQWTVIEYTYGHLDTIAHGQLTPFRAFLSGAKTMWKSRMVRLSEHLIPAGLEYAIGKEASDRLGELVVEIDAMDEYSRQIEWAVDHEGVVWILQATPNA